jgi:hypothetical protein
LALVMLSLGIHWWRRAESPSFRAPHFLKVLHDLPAGGQFDFDDFAIVTDPTADSREFPSDQDVEQLRGGRLARNIRSGELLRWTDFESPSLQVRRQIPPGHRAYVIQPENGWLARPGDSIDILLRPTREGEEPIVLAERVLVLQRLVASSRDHKGGGLVIAMRQRDLELLEKAKQQGKLSVAVLGTNESGSNRSGVSAPGRRAGKARKPRFPARSQPIEIITGAE